MQRFEIPPPSQPVPSLWAMFGRRSLSLIDLVHYHEKSVDDAADILNIPRATVETRMFYARKKLAELMQGA